MTWTTFIIMGTFMVLSQHGKALKYNKTNLNILLYVFVNKREIQSFWGKFLEYLVFYLLVFLCFSIHWQIGLSVKKISIFFFILEHNSSSSFLVSSCCSPSTVRATLGLARYLLLALLIDAKLINIRAGSLRSNHYRFMFQPYRKTHLIYRILVSKIETTILTTLFIK